MVYLITGGAGFIGSHLCAHLLACGNQVIAVDNLSTGLYRNIAHLKDQPNFSIFITDVRNHQVLDHLVQQSEVVFHLAAAVGVRLIIDRPVETLETNILGTHEVLSLAARYNRKTIITSTSEVYGKSASDCFSEDDDSVLGPSTRKRWSYACSKLSDEFLALALHEEKGLPVIIARLFNTVGARQAGRYGMVVPTFVRQALQGEPITVFGTGSQSRCFIHVSEVVDALIKLAQAESALGQVVNLGSNQSITIAELAQKVKEITGSNSEIVTVPYDAAYQKGFEDMERRVPDIRKAYRLIGFNPQKTIVDIIRDVAEEMKREEEIRLI
jgi:UDP-glucose 4-epimerase